MIWYCAFYSCWKTLTVRYSWVKHMSKSLQINFIWFFLFFSSELKLWSFWYSKLLGNYRWMMLIDFSVLPRRLLKHKFYHFSWFNLTLKLNYPSWETLYIHLHKLARSYEVSLKCVAGVVAGVDVVDEVVVDVVYHFSWFTHSEIDVVVLLFCFQGFLCITSNKMNFIRECIRVLQLADSSTGSDLISVLISTAGWSIRIGIGRGPRRCCWCWGSAGVRISLGGRGTTFCGRNSLLSDKTWAVSVWGGGRSLSASEARKSFISNSRKTRLWWWGIPGGKRVSVNWRCLDISSVHDIGFGRYSFKMP